jgi:predicted phage tail protein
MVLSGIASFFGGTKNDKSSESKKSLLFSGGSQTTTEGSRIPIVYGRHKTGIFVLSARIYSYQLV